MFGSDFVVFWSSARRTVLESRRWWCNTSATNALCGSAWPLERTTEFRLCVGQSAGATQLFLNTPLRHQDWRNGRNVKHAPVLGPAVPTFRAGADFRESIAQREDVPTFALVPTFAAHRSRNLFCASASLTALRACCCFALLSWATTLCLPRGFRRILPATSLGPYCHSSKFPTPSMSKGKIRFEVMFFD